VQRVHYLSSLSVVINDGRIAAMASTAEPFACSSEEVHAAECRVVGLFGGVIGAISPVIAAAWQSGDQVVKVHSMHVSKQSICVLGVLLHHAQL
jgi:hypothetical protein